MAGGVWGRRWVGGGCIGWSGGWWVVWEVVGGVGDGGCGGWCGVRWGGGVGSVVYGWMRSWCSWLDGLWVECGVVGWVGGGRCGGGVGSAVCGPTWSNGVWWILRSLVSQGWSSPSRLCATMTAWCLVGRSAVYTSQSGSIGPLHKTCLESAGGGAVLSLRSGVSLSREAIRYAHTARSSYVCA